MTTNPSKKSAELAQIAAMCETINSSHCTLKVEEAKPLMDAYEKLVVRRVDKQSKKSQLVKYAHNLGITDEDIKEIADGLR